MKRASFIEKWKKKIVISHIFNEMQSSFKMNLYSEKTDFSDMFWYIVIIRIFIFHQKIGQETTKHNEYVYDVIRRHGEREL